MDEGAHSGLGSNSWGGGNWTYSKDIKEAVCIGIGDCVVMGGAGDSGWMDDGAVFIEMWNAEGMGDGEEEQEEREKNENLICR